MRMKEAIFLTSDVFAAMMPILLLDHTNTQRRKDITIKGSGSFFYFAGECFFSIQATRKEEVAGAALEHLLLFFSLLLLFFLEAAEDANGGKIFFFNPHVATPKEKQKRMATEGLSLAVL